MNDTIEEKNASEEDKAEKIIQEEFFQIMPTNFPDS